MRSRNEAAVRRHAKALLFAHYADAAAQGKSENRRRFDVGRRKDERSKHAYAMRGFAAAAREGACRQIPDIAVGELAPTPAFLARLIDSDLFAVERLGIERRRRRRRMAERCRRLDHVMSGTFDEAIGFDAAAEVGGGKVGARRRRARIKGAHRANTFA